jgi:hypothetical protein
LPSSGQGIDLVEPWFFAICKNLCGQSLIFYEKYLAAVALLFKTLNEEFRMAQ